MQDNSGNADAGEIVADYCEPAEAAQQIAADQSAAERVMAALPFPDCADFIRYANRRTLFIAFSILLCLQYSTPQMALEL